MWTTKSTALDRDLNKGIKPLKQAALALGRQKFKHKQRLIFVFLTVDCICLVFKCSETPCSGAALQWFPGQHYRDPEAKQTKAWTMADLNFGGMPCDPWRIQEDRAVLWGGTLRPSTTCRLTPSGRLSWCSFSSPPPVWGFAPCPLRTELHNKSTKP